MSIQRYLKVIRRFRTFFILLLALITSCGWHLRGLEQNSPANKTISELHISSYQQNLKFIPLFKQEARRRNIQMTSDAMHTVIIESENLDKRSLAVHSTGVTAQYQLTLNIRYHFLKNGIQQASKTIVSRRRFDFDPKKLIADEREESALVEEMRLELARRIIATAP